MNNVIVFLADGPIILDTGKPAGKYALCRCGLSNNKPFCDGSHKNNFTAQAATLPLVVMQQTDCCEECTCCE